MMRKLALVLGLLLAALGAISAARAAPVEVTDIMGRKVALPAPAKRIVLAQGRHLAVLGLIHPDPVSLLVGWKADMKRDTATYGQWRSLFPALDNVPVVGAAGDDSFSVEKVLALKPDVVVMSFYVGQGGDDARMRKMLAVFDEAGVPVVFVDFFVNPLKNAVGSLRALAQTLDRQEQAEKLIRIYEAHRARVAERLKQANPPRPSVFLHAHAGGMACCATAARGVFDDIVTEAGGRNIAHDLLPGATGAVSLEYLIGQSPDVYAPTGGAHLAARGGFVLGSGVSQADARASLAKLLATPGIASLKAVREKRVVGVWHLFNDTPANIVLLEVLAKQFHPELFRDVDPADTLRQLSAFSVAPFEGAYWVEP